MKPTIPVEYKAPKPIVELVYKIITECHTGFENRITKDDLCKQVFGFSSDYKKRIIRNAVETTRNIKEYKHVIVAYSGTAGYWRFDPANLKDLEIAEKMIAELFARSIKGIMTQQNVEEKIGILCREFQRKQSEIERIMRQELREKEPKETEQLEFAL